jgi:hypothetical protein
MVEGEFLCDTIDPKQIGGRRSTADLVQPKITVDGLQLWNPEESDAEH